jgi:hypothetical protein
MSSNMMQTVLSVVEAEQGISIRWTCAWKVVEWLLHQEWNTVTLLELGTYYVLEAGKAAALGYVAALVQLQRRSYGRR